MCSNELVYKGHFIQTLRERKEMRGGSREEREIALVHGDRGAGLLWVIMAGSRKKIADQSHGQQAKGDHKGPWPHYPP